MTVRRALEGNRVASVRRADGRVLTMRLVVGWDSPVTGRLHDAATTGGGSPLDLALLAALSLSDAVRAVRYRVQGRCDWWLVEQVDDDEPVVSRQPDRASATDVAERVLLAAVAAGGRYLPYGA